MIFNYLRIVQNISKLYFLLILFSIYFQTSKSTLLVNLVVVFGGISPETTTKFIENVLLDAQK